MPDANMLPENSLCQRAVTYLIIVVIICINRFVIRLDDKKKGPSHCSWLEGFLSTVKRTEGGGRGQAGPKIQVTALVLCFDSRGLSLLLEPRLMAC